MDQEQPDAQEGHTATGGPHYGENLCPDCSGTGERRGAPCDTCGGTGRVLEPLYEE